MDRETQGIIDIFGEISRVPRKSKSEEKIAAWITSWADTHRLKHRADSKGNMVIEVPASQEAENAPTLVLQGHMDMVCEKTPDSKHDFDTDPIELVFDGDWITANKTTLGADNGIALALALFAAQEECPRPPLELLFTVDEETGLTGANALSGNFLTGRLLLNLDSEEEGYFTIGCAGGSDALLSFKVHRVAIDSGMKGMEITVGGLAGGHSGAEIHLHRANANKLVTRVVAQLMEKTGAGLVSISGGSVRNAIPRDAAAVVTVPADKVGVALKTVEELQQVFTDEFRSSDSGISLRADPVSLDGAKQIETERALTIVRLLQVLPSGAQEYSADIHGLVETSCNMAVIKDENGTLEVHSSQRSSVMSCLQEITATIKSAGMLAGAEVKGENSYPAWTPDTRSKLLELASGVYAEVFGEKPKIKAIHAGLECGVIGAKYPGMDMLSLGPTILNAHSPDEKVSIPSIGNTWKLLKALLASLAKEKVDG